MNIHFELFPVIPPLVGLIEKIWLFESDGRLPVNDLRMIVPDGRPMLLFALKNGVVASLDEQSFTASQNRISIVGVCDRPAVIDSQFDARTASIGMEFSPGGFYRFFRMPFNELKNKLHLMVDLPGKSGERIEREISSFATPAEQVAQIQLYLHSLLDHHCQDQLFEYCVKRIEASGGELPIAELERITGYSARWLNLKFNERLGLSPKNFSSIIRFQHHYKILMSDRLQSSRRLSHQYYDQSHFIKDFKRFTGMTPGNLVDIENRFGKLFY